MNDQKKIIGVPRLARGTWLLPAALLAAPLCLGQGLANEEEEEIFELSPFTVDGSEDVGYRASSTLAGTRIRTDLKDVGSAISVVTEQFLQDTNATSNETLLMYMPGTEVGGTHSSYQGNYSGGALVDESGFGSPSHNTRVRGLASADNTFNYFLSNVPWDGYVVNRVDMQRGPNSILFGLGSPAGIVNATTDSATFENEGEVQLQFGSYGSTRMVLKANRVLIEDELSILVAGLKDDEKFRQEEAFENDERLYVALRYDPSFLNSDATSTSLDVNFETGSVDANRPRNLPPVDRITPFFNEPGHLDGGFGRSTVSPIGKNDASGRYGWGETVENVNWDPTTNLPLDGETRPNPRYNPILGNFGSVYGSPLMVFGDADSPAIAGPILDTGLNSYNAIGPDGEVDRSLFNPYQNLGALNSYKYYAEQAELPFWETGGYKERSITDPTIFDFYNHLLDGPNKKEWSDFDTLNASFRQTFANNQLGYEVSYFKQNYNDGRVGQFSGNNQAINIDTNSHLIDGSVNPNAGRAFLTDNYRWANSVSESKRDAIRATAFAEYDFQASGRDNWITRLLGKHVFTGMYVEDNHDSEYRSFTRYGFPDEFAAWQHQDRGGPGQEVIRYDSNEMSLSSVHYLGGSLAGRTTAAGAHLPPLTAIHQPTSGTFWTFDDTWNAPSVDPAAPWTPPNPGPVKVDVDGNPLVDISTQSENHANYVGWVQRPLTVYDVLESGRMDNYTNNASLTGSEIKSEALVWQGYFWNRALVGTYGWRRDVASRDTFNAPDRRDANGETIGFVDVSPETFRLDGEAEALEGQSQSWSVAAHLDRLLGLEDKLPIGVSLYYNRSENFQPAAGRVNLYNEPLPPPSGSTKDVSLLLTTRDNRYSLKITDYETSITNAGVDRLGGTWYIGRLYGLGTDHANIYAYDLREGNTLAGQATEEDYERAESEPWTDDRYNMTDMTLEEEKVITDAWYAFLEATPQKFYDAWRFEGLFGDPGNISYQEPSGLTYTQDTISKGTEFEFTAQPTDNWRISANATKTKAIRQNVGGEALIEWVALVDEWMAGPAGDVRIWWGSGPEIRTDFTSAFRNEYSLTQLLEGQVQPDLREWHFALVTNYDFKDGALNGVNVGGSYRWQDKAVIGYPYYYNDEDVAVHDLANPYNGPTEDFVDLWAGYGKQLSDNIHWRVQLNVRNVFADKDDLIPLNTQPDGRPGAYRIPPLTTWTLSNTFSF